MPHRRLIITLSFLLAAAVLTAALVLGPGMESPEPEQARDEAPPPRVPDGFDPSRAQDLEQADFAGAEVVEELSRGQYRFVQDHRQTLLFYEGVQPRDAGVLEVLRPIARVYFSPRQALQIEAETGTFLIPDNQPQAGQFQGQVRVSFFEAEDGQALAFDDPQQMQVQVELDRAWFDLELGQLESDGPVRVSGPDLAFWGRGLTLTYNELSRRIEYLQVMQGERLVVRSGEDAPWGPQRDAPAEPELEPDQTAGEPDVEQLPEASEPAREPVFYQARFQDRVRVLAGRQGEQVQLQADHLHAAFSLEGGAAGASRSTRSDARQRSTALASADSDALAVQMAQQQDERANDELVIEWAGPLTLEPADEADALQGAEDVMLTLLGAPAQAVSGQGQRLQAARIDYHLANDRLRAFSDARTPMRLEAPGQGWLSARQLSFNAEDASARIAGPGRMWAEHAGFDEPEDEQAHADGLQVSWARELELHFHTRGNGASSEPTAFGQLQGLRWASFHGEVEASHEQFTLNTDRLMLAMDEPAAGGALRQVSGHGGSRLGVREADGTRIIDVLADELALALEPDDAGQARPRQFTARGGVYAEHVDFDLRSESLVLDVAGDAEVEEDAELALERVAAETGVRVNVRDPDAALSGQRMVADPQGGWLELFGNAEDPARIDRADAVIASAHLRLDEAEQAIVAERAGWLEAVMDADQPADRLSVSWQRRMRFSDVDERIDVQGDVQLSTRSGDARAQLSTPELAIGLAALDEAEPEQVEPEAPVAGQRRVRSASARGQSDLTYERLTEPEGDVELRLRLHGNRMEFDGDEQTLSVPGQGWMGLEHQQASGQADDEPADEPAVRFTGRGQTVFAWTGSMRMDAQADAVTLSDDVQMVHQPEGEAESVQLDAQRLVADMSETGGLTRLDAGAAPRVRVRMIRADEAVRIVHGERSVDADHLQYTAEDETVLLWAQPGQMVQVRQADRPAPLQAEEFAWDLARDRIEARQIGPGIMPVPGR